MKQPEEKPFEEIQTVETEHPADPGSRSVEDSPAAAKTPPAEGQPDPAPHVPVEIPAGDPPRGGDRVGVILQAVGGFLVVAAVLIALVAWDRLPIKDWLPGAGEQAAQPAAAGLAEETAVTGESAPASGGVAVADISLAPFKPNMTAFGTGITRLADLDTSIPDRARTDVVTYTVEKGDTLFEIADSFGLKPETVLWGNFDVLKDNPHLLAPGQELNILPVNGVYYQWKDGDTLQGVAGQFETDPEKILSFSGNRADLTNRETAGIDPGTWVVIPDGKREIKDWGPPAISRENPASARYYGAGHCGEVYSGAFGTGAFIWPTVDHGISGYNYSGIHPAIDIGGALGNAIFAADSGVVVYAGWSDYGYGNLIVIDHGNGWQTAYAHLSSVGVGCGQSVFQGGVIGALGSTGNSSGPHLHFELVYNGAKPNPLDYVQ